MIFKLIFKRNKNNKEKKLRNKFDIYSWMNLTKEERLKLDEQEKVELMKKKKFLLKSIRDEYLKINKKNNI
tara:strand:- start:366 stop:578 length:213 start_codon:yes stop_codon:yes gene_type:complete